MSKEKKSPEQIEKQFIEEYNKFMSTPLFKTENFQEWRKKGDLIEKFTMYDDYTPVKTSSGTGLIR